MNDLIQSLSTNSWVWLVGYTFGILGFFLAIVFYKKGVRFKQLVYALHSDILIRDFRQAFDSLEVSYGGKPIGNLTSTKLVFWNAGKDTISKGDFASADPLKLYVAPLVTILECHIVAFSSQINAVTVIKQNDKEVSVTFDYLDASQGAVIQVLHTGANSECVQFSGTVKGAKKMKRETRFSNDDVSRLCIFGYQVDPWFSLMGLVGCVGMFSAAAELRWCFVHRYVPHIVSNEVFYSFAFTVSLLLAAIVPLVAVIPRLPKELGRLSMSGWQPKKQ